MCSSSSLERWGFVNFTCSMQPNVLKNDMSGFFLYQASYGVTPFRFFIGVLLRMKTAMETASP